MVLKHSPFRVDSEVALFNSWLNQLGIPTDDDMPGVLKKFGLEGFVTDESAAEASSIKTLKEKVDKPCCDLIMVTLLRRIVSFCLCVLGNVHLQSR